jgi:ribonucleoside-diphosphate reductase beta chain
MWSFFETIHSRAYSHIIRNVYPNPSVVFDELTTIPEILECATDVSKYYDDLIEYGNYYNLLGEGMHNINGNKITISKYELKRKILRALVSVNILEGVRFYVSFACSWAFAEQKKMVGNATIITLIARDENLHLAFTQHMLKMIQKDDKDFAVLFEEECGLYSDMFKEAIDQEKKWATYLFQHGSMLGLNEQIMHNYMDWIGNKRMTSIGLIPFVKGGANPLPWTQQYIGGAEVQAAAQETELTKYLVGGLKSDVSANTFSRFTL